MTDILRLRPLLAAAVLVPMLAAAALSGVLVWRGLQPPVAIVLSGTNEPGRLTADDVPADMARDFALVYLAVFDNYTPATAEEGTRFLKGRIGGEFFVSADEALDRRTRMVLESRMSSSMTFVNPRDAEVAARPDGLREVTARGVRRLYVADKLREERTLLYRVRLAPSMPTAVNPYGLAVVGQSVTTETIKETDRAPAAVVDK